MLRRSAKVLGTAFAGFGLTAAGHSLAKLTKEGDNNDWTIDDLRNVLVGVQSVIGGKRALVDRRLATRPGVKVQAKTSDGGMRLTSKSNRNLQVDISADELRAIGNKKGAERTRAFQELLIDKASNRQLTRNPVNYENYISADGTIKSGPASQLLADFGLNKNTLTSRISSIIKGDKTLALPKERTGRRAERTPRELREIESGARGVGPQLRQWFQNRAIARYQVNYPELAGGRLQTGSREGW